MNMAPELMKLVERFEDVYLPLRDQQHAVADFVRGDSEYPYWAHLKADRETVAAHIELLEYQEDDMDAGGTTSMPAVLGVPYGMLAEVRAINDMRDNLASFLRETDKGVTPEGQRLSKYLLDKVGLRRFNRKVAGRTFRVLDGRPESISFTWSQSTTTHKLSRDEAVAVAVRKIVKTRDKKQLKLLQSEQSLLMELPEGEILARVYEPSPQPKMNIIIDGKRMPVTTAHLPLFYPAKPGERLPVIIPLPKKWEQRLRVRRSDATLDDVPLCPILNIHRYLPEEKLKKKK
ncbi:MAG: hypothetical protein CMH22_10070 [Methylophaga sp.]|uniref:DNA replication terminus site-binding protein n=1 Tax=Methylophaga sp. UBA678 TaxID=1946901 RepID=UPI000C5FBB60|nr:DNA replication terminus site-binding protein [Methylophaga sp. UBA678]MAX52313.1 hypothetical protein [Methylophaga sp.]